LYADQSHRYRRRENLWLDVRQCSEPQLPSSIKSWLLDKGSLTQRLIKSSAGDFKVSILSQGWHRPRHSEAKLLGMHYREQAIIREVVLMCANERWVFARSIIPASSVTGRLRHLSKFDDRPLGAVLFKDPSMQRRPFEIIKMAGNSYQLPPQLHQPTSLWGRRCRFELSGKPLMVSEIFLPSFKN
jgi:chorismate--pyruvate lyase